MEWLSKISTIPKASTLDNKLAHFKELENIFLLIKISYRITTAASLMNVKSESEKSLLKKQ